MSKLNFDHKQLIASLPEEQKAELTRKSDLQGLLNFVTHLLVIGFTGIWIAMGWAGWQIVMVMHGIMLIFLFTLLHETSHFTAFKSPWLNNLIGGICALVIFLPPIWFRYFHLAHHRHTHDPDKDPELEGGKPETLMQYIWTISGIPVWKFHFKTLLMNAFLNPIYDYVPQAGYSKIKKEAWGMIGFYASLLVFSIVAQTATLIWLWLAPIALGQPFLRLYLMAEHGRCPHVANMLENTRTTFTNKFVRWLAWNMPYHAEHHAYPAVPFHKLPKFHKIAKKYLKTTENGYVQFQRKTITSLGQKKV